MSNTINIEQCKITRDSNNVYLDIITDALPDNYTFTKFLVEVFSYNNEKLVQKDSLDLSQGLSEFTTQLRMRVPMQDIVNANPGAFYKIYLEAGDLTTEAWISDVYFAYQCMLNSLLKMSTNDCSEVPDDVIRQYLLLYGHTAAMREGDSNQALYFYKKMMTCGCNTAIPYKPSCGCKL